METPFMIYDPGDMGSRLKKLRKEQNITQEKLAEMLHVSKDTIYNYEKGNTPISHGCIMQLCQEFYVSADYFYFGSDNFIYQNSNNGSSRDIYERLKKRIDPLDDFDMEKVLMMIDIMFREHPAV